MGFTPVNKVKQFAPLKQETVIYEESSENLSDSAVPPSTGGSGTPVTTTTTTVFNSTTEATANNSSNSIKSEHGTANNVSEVPGSKEGSNTPQTAILNGGGPHSQSLSSDAAKLNGARPVTAATIATETTTSGSSLANTGATKDSDMPDADLVVTGASHLNPTASQPSASVSASVSASALSSSASITNATTNGNAFKKPRTSPGNDTIFAEENVKTYAETLPPANNTYENNSDGATSLPGTFSNPYIYAQAKSRANPPINLFTVQVPRAGDDIPTKLQSTNENGERVFGLEQVPTFHPTAAEFDDPITYIQSLADQGKKYGSVKIIPPSTWKSPLGIDIDLFWFKTRRQNLSLRGCGSKADIDFVNSLYYFHKQKNSSIVKLPSIDKRPLDLFHLYQSVQLRGGFEEVCKRKLWAQIGRELGYSGRIMTSLSTSLKSTYQKLLLPFVQYLEDNGAGVLLDGVHVPSIRCPQSFASGDKRPFTEVLTDKPLCRESKKWFRLSNGIEATNDMSLLDDGLSNSSLYPKVSNGARKIHRIRKYSHAVFKQDDAIPSINENWSGDGLMMNPQSWLKFRESPTYNFRQFQQKADKFKEDYFAISHGKGFSKPSEYAVESEYWNILTDSSENIEVEQGLDIHSSVHGSTFPKLEWVPHSANRTREPSQLKDPWNLNTLAYNPRSAFRYVSSEIPFMTDPWLTVGMVFSTQSWNFEDYFSYLIDYMHFGSPKTWYSVPEKDFDKVKQLLIKANQEDKTGGGNWIENDHMLSPQMLKDNGIECYAVDQQPGEFVITFPKAYHAELDHGFNFTARVNFHDANNWHRYAAECLQIYNEARISPPFSLARTLWNMSEDIDMVLNPSAKEYLQQLKDTEIRLRSQAYQKYPNFVTKFLSEPAEVTCPITNDICFFSWIRNPLTGANYSLKAFIDMNLDPGVKYEHVMVFTTPQLEKRNPEEKEVIKPKAWLQDLYTLFEKSPKPNVDEVRKILSRAELETGSNEVVESLRAALTKTAVLMAKVQSYFNSGKIEVDINNMIGKSMNPDYIASFMISPEDFQALLDEVHYCAFSCKDFDKLEARAKEIINFKREMKNMISNDGLSLKTYWDMAQKAMSFNVFLPEVNQLRKLIDEMKWDDECNLIKDDLLDLTKIETFLSRNQSHEHMSKDKMQFIDKLVELQKAGKDLHARVTELFKLTKKNPDTIASLFEQSTKVPMYPETRRSLKELCYKNSSVAMRLSEFEARSSSADVFSRPSYSQVRRLITAHHWFDNKNMITALDNLHIVEGWLEEGQKMIGQEQLFANDFRSYIKNMNEKLRHSFSLNDNFLDEDNKKKRCCICRRAPDANTIRCEICHEEYHLACYNKTPEQEPEPEQQKDAVVATDAGAGASAPTGSGFRCSICDWTVSIPRNNSRPFYKEFVLWVYRAHELPYQADELLELAEMVSTCKGFEIKLQHSIMKPGRVLKQADIPEIKFYLRKLEGSPIFFPGPSRFLFDVLKRLDSRNYPWKSIYADLPDRKRSDESKQNSSSNSQTSTPSK